LAIITLLLLLFVLRIAAQLKRMLSLQSAAELHLQVLAIKKPTKVFIFYLLKLPLICLGRFHLKKQYNLREDALGSSSTPFSLPVHAALLLEGTKVFVNFCHFYH
jgi:hypothetical protein